MVARSAKRFVKNGCDRSQTGAEFSASTLASVGRSPQYWKIIEGSRFSGLWRYRSGDYRILCEIQDEKITVLVVLVGHRREVYA
ncbi:type II toxin-antitoxin system RelE/ParE family toxin [Desulfosarcina sp. OttesenSCG-928-A07]|nr:type II toxin-antitoxin system RelE/ParE family toxin [Desulfosarcina sp. OttesenSCG-928-G17]MDL2329335.1 type II toxin-antitoxin system RelE/ParE family toxin [Desulfosarcina sp. OttesenSCG-928-A07]